MVGKYLMGSLDLRRGGLPLGLFLLKGLKHDVDPRPIQVVAHRIDLVMSHQVLVAHLKHLVYHGISLLVQLTASNKDIGCIEAGVEQDHEVTLLHLVQFLHDFQYLVEAVIREGLSLIFELVTANEYLVIALHVGNSVG